MKIQDKFNGVRGIILLLFMASAASLNFIQTVVGLDGAVVLAAVGDKIEVSVEGTNINKTTTVATVSPRDVDAAPLWSSANWTKIPVVNVSAKSSDGRGTCTLNISGISSEDNTLQARQWTEKWQVSSITDLNGSLSQQDERLTTTPLEVRFPNSVILNGPSPNQIPKQISITDTAIEYRYKVASDDYRYCVSPGRLSAPVSGSDTTYAWTIPPDGATQRIREINY